jgi:hypothetical protein
MLTCVCGHRAYAGYVAEADSLAARSAWLDDRVAAGDPAPEPEVRHAYAIWGPPSATATTAGPPIPPLMTPPAPRGTPSAQTLLLGIGALLLVISGAVFAAVVWDRLGAVGQVALMLTATAGVGALAIRLRTRLAGTAEALAVVAAGLATVDLIAAPLLGLLPERWVSDPTLYPALALAGLGGALLLLQRRFELRAWGWLGWIGVLAGAACVVPAVTSATDSPTWTAAAITVPALASVVMLAASQTSSRRGHRVELRTVGAVGLLVSAAATASAALDRDALAGAVVTTAVTALALWIWTAVDHMPADHEATERRLLPIGAAALSGIAVALILALPREPQPVWIAAAVAVAGLTVGLVLWVLRAEALPAFAGACAVWITWAATRMDTAADTLDGRLVANQLSLLAVLVSAMAFVAAWWVPAAGWIGALLGAVAMLLAPAMWPDPVEVHSLAFATLLLLAGLLWRRRGPTSSLQWLGPAVAMALIPSAVATWVAPWALDASDLGTTGHLVRLGAVLVTCVIAMVIGARLHLGGLLIPASLALAIAALAQVWSGLSNLPRWVGLAIAGTLLVVAGARLERLRTQGRRAVGWVEGLR